MNPIFLHMIVTQAAANKSPQHPHGYCFVPASHHEQLPALEAEGLVEVGRAHAAADGSLPVRPTDAGVKLDAEHGKEPHTPFAPQKHTEQQQVTHSAIELEDNVPLPESKRFGRAASTGGTQLDKYPFATMAVGQSFFVPQDNPPQRDEDGKEKPKHRTFSTVVSNANKKYAPRNFRVVESEKNGVMGARVHRTEDLTGPRPTRTRKKAAAEPHMPAAPGAPAGTAPIAGVDQWPQQGQGFPAPQTGMGGGAPAFPAPAGPLPVQQAGGFPAPQAGDWGGAPAASADLPGWSS